MYTKVNKYLSKHALSGARPKRCMSFKFFKKTECMPIRACTLIRLITAKSFPPRKNIAQLLENAFITCVLSTWCKMNQSSTDELKLHLVIDIFKRFLPYQPGGLEEALSMLAYTGQGLAAPRVAS